MKTIYKKLLFLLLILPFSGLAQSTLSGTVTEQSSGQPLPGVNVVVKGTQNGASTDFDGKFVLANLNKGDVIVFSYVGFKDATVVFQSQTTVSIALEEDANQLSEVVVQVGYGSVKKKDATGSTAIVTAKDFNKGANVTTENLLNGRVAGVTINTSGAPGSGSTIRIRGGSSLNASNDPLIVVDGLPIDNATNTGSTSFLASLNPSTIESFSILKDASATAIYGSRASNGVIIITTKKGTKDLSVDYNFLYGSGKVVETVEVFGADRFRELVAQYKPSEVGLLGNANTNWQDEIYRRTDYVDNSLTLRGNLFKAIPTRLTIGNTYQEGLRLTNEFTRNSASVAMNPSLFKDHLKLRVNANYSGERNRFTDAVESSAIRFDPTQPVRDNGPAYQGFFEYHNALDADGYYPLKNALRNPVAQLLQTDDRGRNTRIFGNVELDYKMHFLPELRAVINLGFDEANGKRGKNIPGRIAASGFSNANQPRGTDEYSEETRKNKLLDAYLVYNKTFNKLNVEITGGYSYQKFEREKFETQNVLNPTSNPDVITDTDVVLIGFFGRTNLSFNDKYLLTLSYRRDGTSRFPESNRWSNFPAAAFAWKMREDFFKDSKTLSDLKLRLGYGITGSQNLTDATNNYYLQQITTGDGVSEYIIGDTPYPIAIPNPRADLKWEETTTYNVGLDYGFFGNRITGAIDAYYKKTEDLIAKAPVADGANFSNSIYQNIGSMNIKGIEFSINADVVKTDNFNWNVNFNANSYQREIEELPFNANIRVGENLGGTGTQNAIFSEGYTPYAFYVYKQLYDTDGHPIEGAYADLNGDNVINGSDKYIYKNPDPDVVLGFASTMNYRNIDFSFNMRASIGNHVYNGVNATWAQTNLFKLDDALNNVPVQVLETGFSTTSDVLLSDIYVENASFLKMDNVTLGYTFPKWLGGKASLRFSAGVQNVFTITKYSGLDPEITNNGLDKSIYPRQRSFLFGVNVKF